MAKTNGKVKRQKQRKSKGAAMIQRATRGSAYVGPREMFEDILHQMRDSMANDPKCRGFTEAPTWEEVLPFVEDGEVGVFIRSEPVGDMYGVTMRIAHPSAIHSGVFYAQLAAEDTARGIVALDERKLLAVKVAPLPEVGEIRRALAAGSVEHSDEAPALDDCVVGGEIGVAMYAKPILGRTDGGVRIWLEYMKPAEAKELGAEARS